MPGALRIGVAIDGPSVPRWIGRLLEDIERDPALALVAVVPAGSSPPEAAREPLAWRLYERVDARLAPLADDALEHVAPPPRLPGAGAPFDLLLDLGAAPLTSDTRTWRVEMTSGWPVSETVIREGGLVVHRSRSASDPGSVRRGRSAQAHAAGFAILRSLRRLARGELEPVADAVPPTGATALRSAVRLLGGVLRRRLQRVLVRDVWAIAVRDARPASGAVPELGSDDWRIVGPPAGRFYADPFVLERPEGRWLLFEEWLDERGRARLAALPLPLPDGPLAPRTVLELDHHLSYPFVFEAEGEVFLLPESADAHRLELWRAVELPDRWTLDTVLFDGPRMFDATVLHRDGRWWMWVTVAAEGGPVTADVSLFHAEALRGPWTEHPRSPISSDVRGARSAGPLYEHAGRLIRPAQDSTGRYGRALVFHEVTTLTSEDYAEVEIGAVEPSALSMPTPAIHTYGRSPGFEVVDVMVRRRPGRA